MKIILMLLFFWSSIGTAADLQDLAEPSNVHLKSLDALYRVIIKEAAWAEETYPQYLKIRVDGKTEADTSEKIIEQIVRNHSRHVGEDYQPSYIDISKRSRSLKNIELSTEQIFSAGPALSPEQRQQFQEILQTSIYRRPHYELFFVKEGNDLGECRDVFIFDRYHSEAVVFGSCRHE